MNLIKPVSNNSVGRITFYIFEIAACILFFIQFILSIVRATQLESFSLFLSDFTSSIIYFFIVYGIGRIIDFLSIQKKADKKEDNNSKEN